MQSLSEIKEEISFAIEAAESYTAASSDLRLSFGEYLDEISEVSTAHTNDNIGLWVGIFDQCIQWLSKFHDILDHEGSLGLGTRAVVPYTIIGASIAQATAIRRLSLNGLDTPARAILRTLYESLNLAVLTIFDNEAERDFLDTNDDEGARDFWNRYVRKKYDKETGLHRSRIDEVFEQALALTGHDDEYVQTILGHLQREVNMATRCVHLSLYAAMFSTKLLSSNRDSLLPGRFGESTLFSVRTLAQSSKWIWLFSRIVHPALLASIYNGKESPLNLDISTQAVVDELVAYYEINILIVDHWNDDRIEIGDHSSDTPD